jgi:chlorite dismutase
MATDRRQYVHFSFYKLDPTWRRLPAAERDQQRAELADLIEAWSGRILLRTYSTIGTRGDCDLMLWQVSEDLDELQSLSADVTATEMGNYLLTPYSYLSMTKHSTYVDEHVHEGQEGSRLTIAPGNAKYLFVYPFTKTRPWYRLPFEERQRIMSAHIVMGHRYPTVKINTTYCFGLDDYEFVLAFETDYPADFLDLVQALRETESSSFTLLDTPIFTCVSAPIRDILRDLKRETPSISTTPTLAR